MSKENPKPPVDPNAAFKKDVERMPTSELVRRIVSAVVAPHLPNGLARFVGSLEDLQAKLDILSGELDARVPAEHKYQPRWPSDYEGSG